MVCGKCGVVARDHVAPHCYNPVPEEVWRDRIRRTMQANVGRNTGPELCLKSALRSAGVRYRSHADQPGTPDVVVRGLPIAVFVDGDYWHGRRWFEHGRAPRANREFWIRKFEANRRRDRRVDRRLRAAGWSVVRVWESDLKADPDGAVCRVLRVMRRRLRSRTRTGRRRPADARPARASRCPASRRRVSAAPSRSR